jgi:hypothetical protein
MLEEMSFSLLVRACPLPRLRVPEICLDDIKHARCAFLRVALCRRVGALGHASCVETCCPPGRVQSHGGYVAKGDPPRSLVLVPVPINPGPAGGGKRTHSKTAAAGIPEQGFLFPRRAVHLPDGDLRKHSPWRRFAFRHRQYDDFS